MLTTKKWTGPNIRRVHLNIPQLLWWLIKPKLAVLIWGRATGKTDGPSAMMSAECMDHMPRSVGRIAAYTYVGLLDNILPGIFAGWEDRYGYIENLHYWVGKKPPAELNIPRPYREPKGDPKNNIYWYNGSVMMLSSMTGTINNGTEYDWLIIEEGRYNKKSAVDELVLAKRGTKSRKRFGHLPYYGATLIVSDRPKNQMGRWLLEYKTQNTPEHIKGILKAWNRIAGLEEKKRQELETGKDASAKKTQTLINKFVELMNGLRMKTTLYSEASTLDNIHALGVSTIKGFIELLDEWDYNISVLNKDVNKAVNGFYALHGENHIHSATNFEAYNESGGKNNCLTDLDCDLSSDLAIAFDVNQAINNVVVGQVKGETIYCTNHMFVLAPEYLTELCNKFCEYYQPHLTKNVTFFYDHTLLGSDAQGKTPDYQIVITVLTNKGFNVTPIYIGQAPTHHILYGKWQRCLSGHEGYLKWSSNATNCHYLRVSMDNADIKYVDGKEKKDKSSERKDYKTQTFLVPPEEATHASEAADTLMLGLQAYRYGSGSGADEPFTG